VGAVKFYVFSELELVGAEILAAFGTDERIAAHVVVNPTVGLIRTPEIKVNRQFRDSA
jgi:hypothetical protein